MSNLNLKLWVWTSRVAQHNYSALFLQWLWLDPWRRNVHVPQVRPLVFCFCFFLKGFKSQFVFWLGSVLSVSLWLKLSINILSLTEGKKNSKLLSVIFQADLDRGGVRVKLLKLKVSCLCRVFSRLDLAWLRPLEFYTCTSSLSGCAGGTQAALES